ncbi:VirD4-like conjugal transfer protein, CD1115 family [Ruoffia tabacinasalis]|uniref:VirD4-like conjugal transfer protein, CD1115 family n=1 Tax=Ruoffia tabacinasalis TaxID=87458 RepID=UPI001486BA23|nr:type IV secretory system conjugative DNA transfer family protein [Ruoffia tabacinasalis]
MTDKKKIVIIVLIMSYFASNYLGNFLANISEILSGGQSNQWVWLIKPSVKYIVFYFLFSFIFSLIAVRLTEFYNVQFGDLRQGNKASSSWASSEEIQISYKEVDYIPKKNLSLKSTDYEGMGGVLIHREDKKAYIDTSDSHGLIVARTRGGKSQTKTLPDIDLLSRSEEKPHLIISSAKYELVEMTKLELEARGYQVHVFNLIDPKMGIQYNPLQLIVQNYQAREIGKAVELTKSFTHSLYHNPKSKDPLWEEAAMSLVNGLILALCYESVGEQIDSESRNPDYVTLPNVLRFLEKLTKPANKEQQLMDIYFNNLDMDNPARMQFTTVNASEKTMRSSIVAVAISKLNMFISPEIEILLSGNTLPFEMLAQEEIPQAIFLTMPDYTNANNIIFSTWIEQVYYHLSIAASQSNDRLPKRIFFLLDEFGNLPKIKSLESMISVGAGRGMLFYFYVQDFLQFKMNYEPEVGSFVESQVMTIHYLSSTSEETNRKIADMIGKYEVIEKSRSGKRYSLNQSISESVIDRYLINPTELKKILEGENVVIRSKRKGEHGEDVIPNPIRNLGENRFKLAYDYLESVFYKTNFETLGIQNNELDSKMKADFRAFLTDFSPHTAQSNSTARSKPLPLKASQYHEQLTKPAFNETEEFQIIKKQVIESIPSLVSEINQLTNAKEFEAFIENHSHELERTGVI